VNIGDEASWREAARLQEGCSKACMPAFEKFLGTGGYGYAARVGPEQGYEGGSYVIKSSVSCMRVWFAV
jgi:hypothetical protein